MRLFLLWSATGRDGRAPRDGRPSVESVQAALAARFQPLFADPLEFRSRVTRCATLLVAEIPEKGWRPASWQEDGGTWAFAPDPPMNAHTVLRARGVTVDDDRAALPTLARAFERGAPDDATRPGAAPHGLAADASDATPREDALLEDLAPPFSLIWGDASADGAGEVHVQTDGLGQAAMFETTLGGGYALTNHVGAFSALGLDLEPVPEEWAVRFTVGWFPLDMTGLRDVRCCRPGTRVRFHAHGVDVRTVDVLARWVAPPAMSVDACHELACTSLVDLARSVKRLWKKPTVGLSGGWDSRCVSSALRHVGAEVDYRVRGHPERYDVIIAHRLAQVAGVPIRVKTKGGQPPTDAAASRRSILGALQWQMGGMPSKKHKVFLAKHPKLGRGVVNVMGQHGGLGKADFVRDVDALSLAPDRWEDALLDWTLASGPPNLQARHLPYVRDVVREAYRTAHDHSLDGLGPLLFYYLNEFTRRWGSATVTSQTGIVYAPILNPGFIRAAYAYPEPEAIVTKPFHRHVISTLAPDWWAVPFTDTITEEDVASGRVPPLPEELVGKADDRKIKPIGRHRTFHQKRYWLYPGKPLLDEALAEGGFWTELFDPDHELTGHHKRADDLVLAHLLPRVLSESEPVGEPED